MHLRILVPLLLAASLAVGCYRHRPYDHDHDSHHRGDGSHQNARGHGPPPHAPAHGYRAKHDGHDLEFDGHRGVYLVIDLPGLFWLDGWYHRRSGDRWQRSDRWDGPWRDSRWDDIPEGLRGGGSGKGKGKKH